MVAWSMSSMHLGAEHISVLDMVCKIAERSPNKPKENELRMMAVTHENNFACLT